MKRTAIASAGFFALAAAAMILSPPHYGDVKAPFLKVVKSQAVGSNANQQVNSDLNAVLFDKRLLGDAGTLMTPSTTSAATIVKTISTTPGEGKALPLAISIDRFVLGAVNGTEAGGSPTSAQRTPNTT